MPVRKQEMTEVSRCGRQMLGLGVGQRRLEAVMRETAKKGFGGTVRWRFGLKVSGRA